MNSNLLPALKQAGIISDTQLQNVESTSITSGTNISEVILDSGILRESELLRHLSSLFGLPNVDLNHYDYVPLCQNLGLRDLITRLNALPIEKNDFSLIVAVADPTISEVEDEFRFATGLQVELVIVDPKELKSAIRRLYGKQIDGQRNGSSKEISVSELDSLVQVGDDEIADIEDLSLDTAPVSRYINQILLDAVRKGASDIHFEPYEEEYRVRLRCDGILVEVQKPSSQLSRRLAARLKILSKLDIAERRIPQDGRIKLKLNADTAIDMRVSTLPTLWGEKIVLRLLDSSAASLDIDKLGYNEQQKALYLNALKKPQGMILMTGPTGSGKTVSLYTGLRILNTPDINISTAEDPVEINLSGINQVQVNPSIGFTFSTALRAFLRQDPDVVMVGEIRDLDTAEIAVKAAQTGHLVLSTLHTNSAAETVIRLANMGVEPFNIASSLSLIIAQRLARKLCSHCKQPFQPTELIAQNLGVSTFDTLYAANPKGCTECNNGYSGRVGIYEVMAFDTDLAQAIIKGANVQQLEHLAKSKGMQTLRDSGIEKLSQGITSYTELQRVLYI